MTLTHYCGPKNPIVNVETDVPRFTIQQRERLVELNRKLAQPPNGQYLSEDEAIVLCLRREQNRFDSAHEETRLIP